MSQSSWLLTGVLIFISIGLIAVVIALVLRTYSQKTTTGKEDLKGRNAVVRETLNPRGVVFIEGELWNALSLSGIIEAGQEVIVSEVKGLTLTVKIKIKE